MTDNDDKGFLSRWSSRKLSKTDLPPAKSEDSPGQENQVETVAESPAGTIAESQPAWQNPELDTASRRQALRDIFKKPGIGVPDGLDEYERDYNYHNFAKLGDVVTHEMRRLLEKQMQELTAVDPEADSKTDSKPQLSESEDNKLA